MLDWFNALITLFGEFLQLLLQLPLYGPVNVGYVLIAIAVFGVVLRVFIEKVK